jgi:signal transduction histidine kinase
MTLVFISISLFFIGATTIIGYQYYQDLEDLIYERTDGAARLFKSEFEADIRRTENALSNYGLTEIVIDNLTLLNQYGPLYSEDSSSENSVIPDADNSYYLQSQLLLVSTLIPLLPQYDLSHLAIYQLAPFSRNENKSKYLSLLIDRKYIWIFRYLSKGESAKREVYRVPFTAVDIEENLFNVSDIYQENANYFFNKIGLKKTDEVPHDFLNELTENNLYTGKASNIVDDKFSVAIWSSILLSLSNPETWQKEVKNSAIILGVKTPTQTTMNRMGEQIGSEFAIIENDHAWISGVNLLSDSGIAANFVESNTDNYVLATQKLDIPSFDDRTFQVMSRTSTLDLNHRTITLFIKLIVIAVVVLTVTGIAMYFLINLILNVPLNSLLNGVQSVEQGELDFKIKVPGRNELSRISASFNDMTSQIQQSSNDLKHANESLELKVKDRTNDLIEAQQQLIMSEKMASLGQLVAGVAHEINTPLGNSITALSYSHEVMKSMRNSFESKKLTSGDFEVFITDIDDSMELIDINLRKASELVQTFKRVAVNQSIEELTDFSVLEQVREVLKTLQPTLKKSNVKINVEINKGIQVTNYPGSFYHIISNLIMNSLIHAFPDKKGNITISVKSDGDELHILFKDDGVGMDEETSRKIFDPFYTTKRGSGGTGLGMYMTYNIVTQRLGGTIEVESKLGEGTQFDICMHHTPPEENIDDSYFDV